MEFLEFLKYCSILFPHFLFFSFNLFRTTFRHEV
jgi:hypothetical protein